MHKFCACDLVILFLMVLALCSQCKLFHELGGIIIMFSCSHLLQPTQLYILLSDIPL